MPRDLPKSDEPNKNENVSNLTKTLSRLFFQQHALKQCSMRHDWSTQHLIRCWRLRLNRTASEDALPVPLGELTCQTRIAALLESVPLSHFQHGIERHD
ncbi:Uncharacterised protein [Vibrio cholerae]|nr:Uncharacterised protein [Vibrio cholerae]